MSQQGRPHRFGCRRLPSDIVKQHHFFTFEVEEEGGLQRAPAVGLHNFLWASDFRVGSQANNGAAGMFEQDDVDNWRQVTEASTSRFGRRHPQDLSMGLGHAGPHPDYPGLVSERYISENNQRLFYRRWEEFMNAGSWADIPLDPLAAPFAGTATLRG